MGVFYYDLLRLSRRGRMVLLRAVYGVVLLLALGAVFVTAFPDQLGFTSGFSRQPREVARLAEEFASTCLLVQLGAVALLAPAVAGGAIAQERQRGTLELLRSCGVSSRAIILGKLAARTLAVAGVVLISLPVLAFPQLWGDVDTAFLLAATAVNLLTIMSLTALGVYFSALTGSTAAATALTYLFTGIFAAAGGLSLLVRFVKEAYLFRERLGLLPFFTGAHPSAKTTFVYLLFHVSVTGVLVAAAARSLRPKDGESDAHHRRRLTVLAMRRGFLRDVGLVYVALRSALAVPMSRLIPARSAVRLAPPPRVGKDPLLWKERYFGTGGVADETLRTASYALVVLQPLVILAPAWPALFDPAQASRWPDEVRPMVTTLGMLMLAVTGLGLTTAAATGLSAERERHTLDALLTLPGGRWDVLRAKWLGSLLRLRAVALASAVPWVVGVLFDAIQPTALPLLLAAAPAHLLFCASLGVCISAVVAGSSRAVLAAVTLAVLLAAVPWLLGDEAIMQPSRPTRVEPSYEVSVACLSPPVVWRLLASDRWEWEHLTRAGWPEAIWLSTAGYAVMAGALLAVAYARLKRDAGRDEV
jgi:ABC-type transport system involved in multi-copper enzyme maturation permease subunit